MSNQQAYDLLAQVCALYKGTLAEHQALQTALMKIDKVINPDKFKEK